MGTRSLLGRDELEELFQLSKTADRFQSMLERARIRHGALVDLLPAVFDEMLRQADIIKRRGLIEGADHRFFLALLLKVAKRTRVLDLVARQFPDKEPVEVIIGWVRELSKINIFRSAEPNVLGIKSIDDTYLEVLAGLLRGLSDKEVTALAGDKPAQLKAEELIASIKSSSLFKAIFTQKASTTAH